MRFKAKFHKNPKSFKDNFTSQSTNYAAYRPGYPENLFRFLAGECRKCNLAWDVGTGNGQAAQKLALHFERYTQPMQVQLRFLMLYPSQTSNMRFQTNRHQHLSDVQ